MLEENGWVLSCPPDNNQIWKLFLLISGMILVRKQNNCKSMKNSWKPWATPSSKRSIFTPILIMSGNFQRKKIQRKIARAKISYIAEKNIIPIILYPFCNKSKIKIPQTKLIYHALGTQNKYLLHNITCHVRVQNNHL